ncbi:MAG: hypothetical protein M3239_04865 [Thermoproteota archaeon]|nr:hypothetical protein [Thermoproteota archaeon]
MADKSNNNRLLRIFSASRYDSRKIPVIVLVVIFALMVDICVSNASTIMVDKFVSINGIALFVAISALCTIGQQLVLGYVRAKSRDIRIKARNLNALDKLVTITQYILVAILVFVIVQIIAASYYYTAALVAATTISNALAGILLAVLAGQFFRSYLSSKRSMVLLLYGLSSATLAFSLVATLIFFDTMLLAVPAAISAASEVTFPFFEPGTALGILRDVYSYSSIAAFLLFVGSTALLLHHYSQRIGKIIYWIIVAIPVVYFLSQILTLWPILAQPSPDVSESYTLYLLTFYTLSPMAGGILFGVAFWTAARSIRHNSIVKDYMNISGYGIVLLLVSSTASVAGASYPPFGLASLSFVGLSSYLVLVGLYSAAVSVSQDSKLRRYIRNSVAKELDLIGSIGSTRMKQEIEKKVINIAKDYSDNMADESGIQSSSTEEDIKHYLEQVLTEVKYKNIGGHTSDDSEKRGREQGSSNVV